MSGRRKRVPSCDRIQPAVGPGNELLCPDFLGFPHPAVLTAGHDFTKVTVE
jgi:hypothetical protein